MNESVKEEALVIDYGMGNLGSVLNMLKHIGASAKISSKPEDIAKAKRLVLPGVGSFDYGMKNLRDRMLLEVLHERVLKDKVPILGLCLGMQLLVDKSEEGTLPGLGWIPGEVVKFQATKERRVPHMGWNTLKIQMEDSGLFSNKNEETRFYFVHSYYMKCKNPLHSMATTDYLGTEFSSAVRKENIFGVQFHPEKSHSFGMQLFRNFLSYTEAAAGRS
jgi:glutamine amidotransferase